MADASGTCKGTEVFEPLHGPSVVGGSSFVHPSERGLLNSSRERCGRSVSLSALGLIFASRGDTTTVATLCLFGRARSCVRGRLI